jgi:hypothetical protein
MFDTMTAPRLHPQVAARQLEDRAIVVLADAGEVLVLNPNGAWLWQRIDGRRTVGELAAGLAQACGVDEARVQQDTSAFVESLVAAGAVET